MEQPSTLDNSRAVTYARIMQALSPALSRFRVGMDELRQEFGAINKIEEWDTAEAHSWRAIITIRVLR